MSRKELQPSDITAIIDQKEQLPYDLSPLKSIRGTMSTADYTVLGLEHHVAVERKSCADFLSVVGGGRERFDRECMRLLAFPVRLIIVEASWSNLATGTDLDGNEWRSQVKPEAAMGSAIGWVVKGLPIHFGGSREACQIYVARFLFQAARIRWRENQGLMAGLKVSSSDVPASSPL